INMTGAIMQEAPQRVQALRRRWKLPVGQPFRQETWGQAKEQMLYALQRRRYPLAKRVSSQARINPETHTAALALTYDSGLPFSLGELQISGTRRYPPSIIDYVNPLVVGEAY